MQDLRLAVRSLRATPIVTAVAILSLALGIGANTAVFSLLDSVALRSLPIADPDRLVRLSGVNAPEEGGPYSWQMYEAVRAHSNLFNGTAAYNCCGRSPMTAGGDTQTVNRMWVSGDFFSTLGVTAAIGRVINADDDKPGGGPDGIATVITDRLWRERFNGRRDIVGTRVTIERAPVTIVGVLPPDFIGLEVGRAIDLALPEWSVPSVLPTFPFSTEGANLAILVRLRSDRSLPATIDALHAVQPELRAETMPKNVTVPDWLKAPLTLLPAGRGTSTLRQHFEQPLVVLLAVVMLVLLVACGNLANLLLARGAARTSELAIRATLGASRWQIVRPLLSESIVLVATGTASGLLFARWATHAMTTALSTTTGRIVFDARLDWRLLAFAIGITTATVLLFGMVPALRAAGVDPIEGLKVHGRGIAGGRRGMSSGLLVAQTAVSLALVVAAALFVKTFQQLVRAPLGFDRDHVLMVTVTAPTVPMSQRQTLYHRMVKAAADVPGVAGAGGSLNPPLIGMMIGDFVVSEPGTRPLPSAEPISRGDTVTPGWFNAEGMTLLDGRDFEDHDTLQSEHVGIVNKAFVERFLGGRRDVVGARLALTIRLPILGDVAWDTRRIVGVVSDSVYRSVRDTPKPAMYSPLAQFDAPLRYTNFFIVVRSQTTSPQSLTHRLTTALAALHDDVRLQFQPVSEQVDDAIAQDRLVAAISLFVGGLALLLAAIGLYGVTSYNVERQRSEIGIRLALGAQPNGVLRLMLLRVTLLVGTGIIIGAVISLWGSKFVASLLYGVQPRDPVTLISAAAILATVGAVAGWLPAWRASRIDPAEVLRET